MSKANNDLQQNAPTKRKKIWTYVIVALVATICFLSGCLTMWLSLDKEVRTLITLKNRMDSSYVYDISDEDFYSAVFDGINQNLLDKYSAYMTREEYEEMLAKSAGKRDGVGLEFSTKTPNGDDRLLIVRVTGNSPAERAGLFSGDEIVAYGKTQETLIDNRSYTDFRAFVDGLQAGESLCLKVLRGDAYAYFTLTPAPYVENYVIYRTNATAYRFTGGNALTFTQYNEPLETLANDTAYIRLTQFNGSASEQFDRAMAQFKTDGKINLILDLRGNGGGYLDIMQRIAGYFCKNSDEMYPVVVTSKSKSGNVERYRANGNRFYDYFTKNSRICVLADGSTASASECLLGCMLDYGAISYKDICLSMRGGVAKTYGKGIMQTTYQLSLFERDAVKLTTAKIYWPISGNCIHERGILPIDGTKTVEENYQKDEEITQAISALFA